MVVPVQRRQWRMLGVDGYWTLLLSMLIGIATLGLTLLSALVYVLRYALGTPTAAQLGDWLVVFGHALRKGEVDEVYAARLRRALALAHTTPDARLLLLGGNTTDAPLSEAAAGAAVLQARGVAAHRIQLEENSRFTLENLQEARARLGVLTTPPVFLSSRYHLARIHVFAKDMHLIPHVLCAAEDRLPLAPRRVLRLLVEAIYLHWYWVARGWAALTRRPHRLGLIR